MLVAIANARSYGGGMLVAPTAEIEDGLLDLVVVKDLSRLEFLRAFPRVFKGSHLSHPKVLHRRFKVLEIVPDALAPYLSDGEMLPTGNLHVEVVPHALTVVIP
jgi:diacylglycerol kinase (ATP)